MRASSFFALPLLAALAGCPPEADPDPTRFMSCGDPACSGYSGPFEGVPLCDDAAVGDGCSDTDGSCDPEDDCNALLVCATEDPTQQEGGCPISRKHAKRDIHYLTPEERTALAGSALDMKLSTWRYRWDAPDAPLHLGFLIDDHEDSHAVTADGQHVDLYGYTSLALAAAQDQERRLDAQDAVIAAQQARIDALEARLVVLEAAARGGSAAR